MSIHKLKTKSGEVVWLARVYLGGRGGDRINRRFKKKSDAEKFELNFENELNDRRTNPFRTHEFTDWSFAEEAEAWLVNAELRFAPGYLILARAVLRDLYPTHGNLPLSKFVPQVISDYQRSEKRKGLTDATVNRKVQLMVAILNYAVKNRRIPFNPSNGYTKLREPQKEISFWSDDEAKSFLRYANARYPPGSASRWIFVVYLLALNTGMRAGEIWGLKVTDFVTAKNLLLVKRQFENVTKTMRPTKSSGLHRMVPCNRELAGELRTIAESERVQTRCRKSEKTLASLNTIFRGETGAPIHHENFVRRIFKPDLKAWKGRAIRFHDLRHTAATLMVSAGIDLRTAKEILGHADIETTLNYTHLVASVVEDVPERFFISPN